MDIHIESCALEQVFKKKITDTLRGFLEIIMDALTDVPLDSKLLPVLSHKMLIRIFSYLSYGDLQQIKFVCKDWYHLASAPELQGKFKLVITERNLSDIYDFMERRKDLLEYLTYESVEVNEYRTNSPNFQSLVKVLRNLGTHIFKLKLRKLSTLSSINDHLPNLKELDLSQLLPDSEQYSKSQVNFGKFGSLESLLVPVFSNPTLYQLLSSVKVPLKKLSVTLFSDWMHTVLPFLKTCASLLRWLEINRINADLGVHKLELQEVFKKFVQLEVLIIDLKYILTIDFSKIILTSLPQENSLTTIETICDADLINLIVRKWSSSLECLRLRNNGVQGDFIKQLSSLNGKLRHLHLYCSAFIHEELLDGLALKTNVMLTGLNLGGINILNEEIFHQLLQNLPNLTVLNLIHCKVDLDDESMECIFSHLVHLRHLLLKPCTSDEYIESLYEKANITNLKWLHTLVSCYCPIAVLSDLNLNFKFRELNKLGLQTCSRGRDGPDYRLKYINECFPALEELTSEDDTDNMLTLDEFQEIHKNLPRLREGFQNYSNIRISNKAIPNSDNHKSKRNNEIL
uniref:F-box domain-containing protein n=1 Tax=Glossina brevipalpis TaxID=37001 RepID=A0A1A9WPB7_9MUSC